MGSHNTCHLHTEFQVYGIGQCSMSFPASVTCNLIILTADKQFQTQAGGQPERHMNHVNMSKDKIKSTDRKLLVLAVLFQQSNNNNKTTTTITILQPLNGPTCVSWHLQLRTGGLR